MIAFDNAIEVVVKKFNLHDVYSFGKTLQAIAGIKEGDLTKDVIWALWAARSQLKQVIAEGGMHQGATKRAAKKLIDAIGLSVPDDMGAVFTMADDKTIQRFDHMMLESALKEFESVLGNDMPGVVAYLVSKKGIYDTEALIDNAELQLLPAFQAMLPEKAKNDIRAAGKCLAFELPTACTFHLWRAVETVMGFYFFCLTEKTWEEAGIQRNWGAYTKALEKEKAEQKVTEFLTHIRNEYRNPQTHPDEVVSIGDAQQLFGAAISSIEQMLGVISKLPAKTPQLPGLEDSGNVVAIGAKAAGILEAAVGLVENMKDAEKNKPAEAG